MELEIQQVLVVSTGHVTLEESKLFNEGIAPNNHTVWQCEYGWMFYVGTRGDLKEWRDDLFISPGLRGVIEAAWKHGLEWIKLDSDGPYLDGIPTYEW